MPFRLNHLIRLRASANTAATRHLHPRPTNSMPRNIEATTGTDRLTARDDRTERHYLPLFAVGGLVLRDIRRQLAFPKAASGLAGPLLAPCPVLNTAFAGKLLGRRGADGMLERACGRSRLCT